MARRYFCGLMSWLFFIHMTMATAAAAPQKKYVRQRSAASRGSKAKAVLPHFIPPQVPGAMPSHTARQQILPVSGQDKTKKNGYIAEEMVMQRTWLYSAVLPGWGQVYNQHHWKVPVIYVGFATLFGGAVYYHRHYRMCKRELENKGYANLINYLDECRQGRDLCLIFAALWYVINVCDAYVGASLKTFTLSDDISMEVQPTVLPIPHHSPTIGLSLTLNVGT